MVVPVEPGGQMTKLVIDKFYQVEFLDHYTIEEVTLNEAIQAGDTTIEILGKYLGDDENYHMFQQELIEYSVGHNVRVFFVLKGTIKSLKRLK